MTPRTSRPGRWFLLLAALALAIPGRAIAHEIPSRVTVLAFVRPLSHRLQVIIRVPLQAMRDVEFPLRDQGFLELDRVGPTLIEAANVWLAGSLAFEEAGRPLTGPRILAARISLPTDRSFESWDSALAHVTGPALPANTELVWQQALLDVELEYVIDSDHSSFSITPTLARLGVRTSTVLRFLPAGRAERAYQFIGDPGEVRLDPEWYHAFLRFVKTGFLHILDGIDHLLFILCLVIPFRRWRPLVVIITSFTLAHSVTLIASALGLVPSALWFPPLIETLIAVSILYMAFENIVGAKAGRRWVLAFGFGLVHGFGFSFFLRDSLQFAGAHLATSLVAFNIGVELGQLFVLLLTIPVLNWLFRRVVRERMGIILLSALVAHTAWHWMIDRGTVLRQYEFEWPVLDAVFLGQLLRALLLLLVIGAVGTLMLGVVRKLGRAGTPAPGVER